MGCNIKKDTMKTKRHETISSYIYIYLYINIYIYIYIFPFNSFNCLFYSFLLTGLLLNLEIWCVYFCSFIYNVFHYGFSLAGGENKIFGFLVNEQKGNIFKGRGEETLFNGIKKVFHLTHQKYSENQESIEKTR